VRVKRVDGGGGWGKRLSEGVLVRVRGEKKGNLGVLTGPDPTHQTLKPVLKKTRESTKRGGKCSKLGSAKTVQLEHGCFFFFLGGDNLLPSWSVIRLGGV